MCNNYKLKVRIGLSGVILCDVMKRNLKKSLNGQTLEIIFGSNVKDLFKN